MPTRSTLVTLTQIQKQLRVSTHIHMPTSLMPKYLTLWTMSSPSTSCPRFAYSTQFIHSRFLSSSVQTLCWVLNSHPVETLVCGIFPFSRQNRRTHLPPDSSKMLQWVLQPRSDFVSFPWMESHYYSNLEHQINTDWGGASYMSSPARGATEAGDGLDPHSTISSQSPSPWIMFFFPHVSFCFDGRDHVMLRFGVFHITNIMRISKEKIVTEKTESLWVKSENWRWHSAAVRYSGAVGHVAKTKHTQVLE